MNRKEWTRVGALIVVFFIFYFLPMRSKIVLDAVVAGLALLSEYAQKHVLTCLVPAFFIAGGISVFMKKEAILKLLGPSAPKYIAYPIASVSGGILAVCSCTILPLFAGIYKRGAGIGPAVAFLFTGPAINVTAIFLTSRAIGWDFAIARLIAAMIISVITGLIMAAIFREHDEANKQNGQFGIGEESKPYSNLTVAVFFLTQLLILVILGLRISLAIKYSIAVLALLVLLGIVFFKYQREDNRQWMLETWDLVKKITPYLFAGVFAAGVLGVVLPQSFVQRLVGGNSIVANGVASVSGALMYFATLTEVPIIQQLLQLGMGRGPALALFLTGNALSLPSMIVLYSIMGRKQATVYILLIVILSTGAGMLFGLLFP